MSTAPEKPVTSTKIPGTVVPDVLKTESADDRQRAWMSRVAVSTAVMAAMAAISSSMSSGHLNEAMISQIRTSDQWAHYQAKSVKAAIVESRVEAAKESQQPPSQADTDRLAKYKTEQEDLSGKATREQAETDRHLARYKAMSHAATALQIGIGVAAVALLLRKNIYWALALMAGGVGTFFLVQGLFLL